MSKNTPTLIRTAAEMRSNGASWAAVGRSVGRSPRTCEQWPRLFRLAWDGLYQDAEGRRCTETGGEATAVLQKLLRDGDDKTKLRSADLLLRTRHQQLMREPTTATRPSKRPSETLGLRRASVSLAQADCLQKQLLPEASTNALDEKRPNPESPADESSPAVANTPNDDVLSVSGRLLSDAVPLADPDPAALPTPAVAHTAPNNFIPYSFRMAFGVILLISTLLLTALSQQQSNAGGRFDSSGNSGREPARNRAIPLDIKLEKALNSAVFAAARLAPCCTNKPSDTLRLSTPVAPGCTNGFWRALCRFGTSRK